MAASNSTAQSAVIAADLSKPFAPRKLIAELLRTKYCVPGSILLVEGIDTQIPVSKRYSAVRLLLGDGELCLQALLRPELHRPLDYGQISVGYYVRLKRFELRSVLVRSDHEETGSKEPEEMVFLVAWDLSVVGWNTAYMQMAGTAFQELSIETRRPDSGARKEGHDARHGREPPKAPQTMVTEDPLAKDTNLVSEGCTESRTEATAQQHRTGMSTSSYPATDNLPLVSYDLSKPLKLTPLKSIPNLPYKQNWIVNIMAIVTSLSDIEPATLPPFKQRIARLADPSTSKQVHLTVFLDPDEFAPSVGSVVLLLGVKNHRFDGGSLKKYGNERVKEDSSWWLEDPSNLDWCDVGGLKKWWSEQPS